MNIDVYFCSVYLQMHSSGKTAGTDMLVEHSTTTKITLEKGTTCVVPPGVLVRLNLNSKRWICLSNTAPQQRSCSKKEPHVSSHQGCSYALMFIPNGVLCSLQKWSQDKFLFLVPMFENYTFMSI